MSYHISHVIANVSDSLVTHAFIHILKDGSQDNQIVTAVLHHVLTQLRRMGIKTVFLRSDNAGCYHSAKTMFSLNSISERTGVHIQRYTFSEPQNGKSSCDRVASQIKRQVREHVDRKNDVTTSEEFFEALKVRPMLSTSFYLADLNGRESGQKSPITINGMSGLYDFTIDSTFLTARRYHGIGEGIKVTLNPDFANKATLQIIDKGGYVAGKTNEVQEKVVLTHLIKYEPLFWRPGHNIVRRSFHRTVEYKESVVQSDEHHHQEDSSPNNVFRCPVAGCSARFLYFGSLEHHLDRGKHNSAPERKTLRDEALHTFRLSLEDLFVPVSTRVEAVTKALEKLRHHKNTTCQTCQKDGPFVHEPNKEGSLILFMRGSRLYSKKG